MPASTIEFASENALEWSAVPYTRRECPEAAMALMAAETLGVPYEHVKAHVGDPESTGFCNVTGGCRTTFATGMAVVHACERPIASLMAQPIRLPPNGRRPSLTRRSPTVRWGYYIVQCKQRAALTWDLDEEQVDWADGEAVPKPGVNADVKPLSLADIARSAGRTGGPLLGRASLNAQGSVGTWRSRF